MNYVVSVVDFLALMFTLLSAVFWFASSCVKILEPGATLHLIPPTAEDFKNLDDGYEEKNCPTNASVKIFLDCLYNIVQDFCSLLRHKSLHKFFHFNEATTDLATSIYVAGLLNQRAAVFASLAAICFFITNILE